MKKIFLLGLLGLFLVSSAYAGTKVYGGFAYDKIALKDNALGHAHIMGEMKNNSGKNYQAALFTIIGYDENDNILDTVTTTINNFPNNSIKVFDDFLQIHASEIKRIKIQFDDGY